MVHGIGIESKPHDGFILIIPYIPFIPMFFPLPSSPTCIFDIVHHSALGMQVEKRKMQVTPSRLWLAPKIKRLDLCGSFSVSPLKKVSVFNSCNWFELRLSDRACHLNLYLSTYRESAAGPGSAISKEAWYRR